MQPLRLRGPGGLRRADEPFQEPCRRPRAGQVRAAGLGGHAVSVPGVVHGCRLRLSPSGGDGAGCQRGERPEKGGVHRRRGRRAGGPGPPDPGERPGLRRPVRPGEGGIRGGGVGRSRRGPHHPGLLRPDHRGLRSSGGGAVDGRAGGPPSGGPPRPGVLPQADDDRGLFLIV